MEHRILVDDRLEALGAYLGEQLHRLGHEFRLELEMAHASVPAIRVAVGGEENQAVARDTPFAQQPRQAAQLGGVFEVPGRLQEAQGPARRQGRAAQQRTHLGQRAPKIGTAQVVPVEAAALCPVDDPGFAIRPADDEAGIAGVVEEEAVAGRREQQRHADVRAWAMHEVAVPELASAVEPIELLAALTQAVEVLLTSPGEVCRDALPFGGLLLLRGRGTGPHGPAHLGAHPFGDRCPEERRAPGIAGR